MRRSPTLNFCICGGWIRPHLVSIFITLATRLCAGQEQEEEGLRRTVGNCPFTCCYSGAICSLWFWLLPEKRKKTGNNCIITRLRPNNPAGCTSLSAVLWKTAGRRQRYGLIISQTSLNWSKLEINLSIKLIVNRISDEVRMGSQLFPYHISSLICFRDVCARHNEPWQVFMAAICTGNTWGATLHWCI